MDPHLTVIFIWTKHRSLIILTVKTFRFIKSILLISWDCFLFSWDRNRVFDFLVKWCRILLLFNLSFWRFRVHINDVEIIFDFVVWSNFLIFWVLFKLGYSDFIWPLYFLRGLFNFCFNFFLSLCGFKPRVLCYWLWSEWRLQCLRNINILLFSRKKRRSLLKELFSKNGFYFHLKFNLISLWIRLRPWILFTFMIFSFIILNLSQISSDLLFCFFVLFYLLFI